MSDALLIPMTLEVLLVNEALRGRDTFRTWRHTYTALRDFGSPEPMPFDGDFDDTRVGAFLHWTLPRALRAGASGSSTDFPLVPNRWLINRVSRSPTGEATLKSWVLESDHIHNDATASSYYLVAREVLDDWNSKAAASTAAGTNAKTKVVPYGLALPSTPWQAGASSPDAYPVNLGKAFELDKWEEPEPAQQTNLFLTAIAPGNLEFSGYVPFNEGVFSFFDELTLIDEATVSYQVTGWYSDSAPMPTQATAEALQALTDSLAVLNWCLPAGTTPDLLPDGQLTHSLYAGTAYGLPWNRNSTLAPLQADDELEKTRHAQNLNVALANNGADAFSTLVATQLATDRPAYDATAELLRAFHYDLLPLLDKPNGRELLGERIRQEWFSSRAGGTQWAIVTPEATQSPGAATAQNGIAIAAKAVLTPEEKEQLRLRNQQEAARLHKLNQDELAVDECVAMLMSLQWDLHAAWWKQGYLAAAPEPEATAATDELTTLQKNVADQLENLNGLLQKVPNASPAQGGTSQQDFLDAVAAFAKQEFNSGQGLSAGKVLKAVAQPRYWLPGNPSVVLSQVQPSEITSPNENLTVRLPRQLVCTLVLQDGRELTLPPAGSANAGAFSPPPALPRGVPEGVLGLYEEFCLLDPTNELYLVPKTDKSKNKAVPPSVLPEPGKLPVRWQQQWHPLYMEWEATYTHIPFVNPVTGDSNWLFNGTDYELKTAVHSAATPRVLHGRSLLSPSAQLTFQARLKKFVDHFGTNAGTNAAGTNTAAADALTELYKKIAKVDGWKFLSQDLVGLNDLLTQRDTRAFRMPGDKPYEATAKDGTKTTLSLAQLLGYTAAPAGTPAARYNTPAYAQGLLHAVPAIAPTRHGASAFPFHALRSGQLYLSHLVLYDKFGRQLDLVMPEAAGMLDANVFPLIRDAALLPTLNLTPNIEMPVQLPPRLLQPARLNLRLVDHRTKEQPAADTPLATDHLAIMPNPPAKQAHAEAMTPVGGWVLVNHLDNALLLYAPDGTSQGELLTNHEQVVEWAAPPHTPGMLGVDADRYPRLADFKAGIEGMSKAQFQTLRDVIDSTLWTVDPLGNRADQNLSVLVGRPLALVAVQAQLSLYGPAMTGHDWAADPAAGPAPRFSVRLGNQASREDGVIGYFTPGGDGKTINYRVFNSVVEPDYRNQPEVRQKYVQQIGPLGAHPDDKPGNYVTLAVGEPPLSLILLVDPRATIHATTGLLPVKTLTLPKQFVDRPLANLEMSFRVGPLLSRIKRVEKPPQTPEEKAAAKAAAENAATSPTAAPAAEASAADNAGLGPRAADLFPALSYLPLSEKNGTWAWLKNAPPAAAGVAAAAPEEYPLTPADTRAVFASGPASLHEGYLLFRGGQDDNTQAPHPGSKEE